MIIIITENINHEKNKTYEGFEFANFHYLHGELEQWNGYDLISWNKNPGDGIWDALVIKNDLSDLKKAKIFIWTPTHEKQKGLCVLENDIEAFEDAQIKYKNKEYFI